MLFSIKAFLILSYQVSEQFYIKTNGIIQMRNNKTCR